MGYYSNSLLIRTLLVVSTTCVHGCPFSGPLSSSFSQKPVMVPEVNLETQSTVMITNAYYV